MSIAQRVAAVLAAAAIATPVVAIHEGWINVGYSDPVGIATACAGHTGPDVKVGRVYSDNECMMLLGQDLVSHGLEIDRCLPAELPTETRGAFISFAYNVGAPTFCSSTLAAKARARDLAGACAELSRWTKAGGKDLPGLVKRRKVERAMCEKGLQG